MRIVCGDGGGEEELDELSERWRRLRAVWRGLCNLGTHGGRGAQTTDLRYERAGLEGVGVPDQPVSGKKRRETS